VVHNNIVNSFISQSFSDIIQMNPQHKQLWINQLLVNSFNSTDKSSQKKKKKKSQYLKKIKKISFIRFMVPQKFHQFL